MRLTHETSVPAARARVWGLLLDLPRAGRCVPGVEEVVRVDDDVYRGRMRVSIGPVRLGLAGEVRIVQRDDEAGMALLRFEATDARLGGQVRADVALQLAGMSPTAIVITSDVVVLGRLGELGQSLIARKADQIMSEFAANLRRELS